jgi:hypothetical protein
MNDIIVRPGLLGDLDVINSIYITMFAIRM